METERRCWEGEGDREEVFRGGRSYKGRAGVRRGVELKGPIADWVERTLIV